MEKVKNRNGFLITCVSCIVLILVMCYLGVNSSMKGTSAAEESCTCPAGGTLLSGNVCFKTSTTKLDGWTCSESSGVYSCTQDATCDSSSDSSDSSEDGNFLESVSGDDCKKFTTNTASDLADCAVRFGSTWIGNCTKGSTTMDVVLSLYNCTCTNTTYDCGYTCFKNTSTGKYHWLSESASGMSYLQEMSSYTTQSSCEANNNKQCYQCNSDTNLLKWSASTPTETCGGGWHTISKTESECVTPNKYTVSYAACDGSGAPSSREVYSGVEISLSTVEPTRTGYTFKGWTTSGCGQSTATYQPGASYTVSSAVTFSAVWSANSTGTNPGTTPTTYTYTGTYMNGSTTWDTETCNTTSGSCTMPLPSAGNPTKSGYTFKGWGTSSSCTSGFTTAQSVSGNKTYYACWVEDTSASSSSSSSSSKTSSSSSSSKVTSSSSSSSNVSSNPPTGEIAIFVVWVIAAAAIVYSVWYFRQVRKGN